LVGPWRLTAPPILADTIGALKLPDAGLAIGVGVVPTVGVVPGVAVGVIPMVGVGVGVGFVLVGVGVRVGVVPTVGVVGTGVEPTGVRPAPDPLFCVGVAVRPGSGVTGVGVALLPNGPAVRIIGRCTERSVVSSRATTW